MSHGRVVGLKQVLLDVSDLAVSGRFYGHLLGLQLLRAQGPIAVYAAGAGGVIMLHGPSANSPEPSPGNSEIWLQVEGVDGLAGHLRAHGVEVLGPQAMPWGERVAFLQDPDGYRIALAELPV